MKKKIIIIVVALIIVIVSLLFWREKTTWSWQDYNECADAGHPTIEPNPPTCFHSNGDKITPGRSKK